MSTARYWHTVRHLRPWQVAGRVWFRIYQPRIERRPAPPRRAAGRPWQPFTWREPSLVGPDTFEFLNVRGRVVTADDWNDTSREHLWLYNLHYFDDLAARAFEERRLWHNTIIERWIAENRPGAGTGWSPYPTSLRIGNWIKWLLASPAASPVSGRLTDSLAMQVRWLSRRLETHLLGNHLWTNAKALVMGAAFFDGPEADGWRRRGLSLIEAELTEQVLPDGGHYERSPMYHAIVLEDVLDLVQLSGVFPGVVPAPLVTRLRSTATRMLRWLRVMSHPDGQISFFNDAAWGVAAPWGELAGYAGGLGIEVDRQPFGRVEVLPDSGYVRLAADRAIVICDLAPVGPDYQPAHAHADTLSFELSVDGQRMVVNGGTSTYTAGAERMRQRGTAAHSTVEVNNTNSSDVWGSFRVARRARPFDVKSGVDGDRAWAEGAHDGYRPVVHRRSWSLERRELTVTDRIEGGHSRAVARFILHPDAALALGFETEPPAQLKRTPASWHPQFGRSRDTLAVEVEWSGPHVITHIRWQ